MKPSEGSAALELRAVVKDFDGGRPGVKLRALDHLSLRVPPGQVYGLIGPNGSGKSTALKLLLGLWQPTAGECRIFGVPSSRLEARRHVGYLPESPYFHQHLTGRELVTFHARLCGLSGRELVTRVGAILEQMGVLEAADRRVRTYSKGMLQRIGLAQALIHDPRALILDEPAAGVDPAGVALICELLLKLKSGGKTIFVTSHLLPQLEEICDAIGILDQGRLVFNGIVADLKGRGERQALIVDALSATELAGLDDWLTGRGRMLHAVTAPPSRLEQLYRQQVGRRENP